MAVSRSLRRDRAGAAIAALGVMALMLVGCSAGLSEASSKPVPLAEIAAPSAPASPTPEPIPTTVATEHVDEVIPFERTTVDDAAVAEGTSTVTTAGVDGTRRLTYEVTYVDGKEVDRTLVGETTVLAPVAEVTTRGTKKPPPVTKPVPLAQPKGECDPNYAGACVPIASDVDCAGGSGDGPAYLSGQARVVGKDIYKLDRDKNGIACD